jgi:hypothetical protein
MPNFAQQRMLSEFLKGTPFDQPDGAFAEADN